MIPPLKFTILAFALVCSLGSVLSGPTASAQDDLLPVAVLEADYQAAAEISESYAGVVQVRRESRLGFETGGLVAAVHADVGEGVAQGDLLAELDLRALQAELDVARSGVEEAQAAANLAAATVRRQEELLKGGHISQQALDEANANAGVANARVQAAEARRAQVETRLTLAQLTAPYDGVITARHVDEGDVAGPGAPILSLAEGGAVEFSVGLPVEQARRLTADKEYVITVNGQSARVKLRAQTGLVDQGSQTVLAVFDVNDTEIAPGQVARLQLSSLVDSKGFWAPLEALSEGRRGLWTVFTVRQAADGQGHELERRTVEVLYTEQDRAYIRGAVEDEEMFVARGLDRVAPGQRVTPRAVDIGDAGAISTAALLDEADEEPSPHR